MQAHQRYGVPVFSLSLLKHIMLRRSVFQYKLFQNHGATSLQVKQPSSRFAKGFNMAFLAPHYSAVYLQLG
jgi:hypothetical protein